MLADSRHRTDTGRSSPTSPRDSVLTVPPEVPPKNSPPITHRNLRSAGMRYLDSLGTLGSLPPPPPPPVPPPPVVPRPASGEWYAQPPAWYAPPPPPPPDPLSLVPDDLDKHVPPAWYECVGGDRLAALCLWRGLRGSTRLRFHIVEGYVRFLKTKPLAVPQPYLAANPRDVEAWVARRANDRLKDGVAAPEFVKTELLGHVDFLIDLHRDIGLMCIINRARVEMVIRGAMRIYGYGEDDVEPPEPAQPAEAERENESA